VAELRENNSTIRIQIAKGTNYNDAVRLLKKMAECFEHDPRFWMGDYSIEEIVADAECSELRFSDETAAQIIQGQTKQNDKTHNN